MQNWALEHESDAMSLMTRATGPWVLPWARRLPWIASAAYVGVLAISSGRGNPDAWFAAAIGLVLAIVAARAPSRVARSVGWGLAVVVASAGASGVSRAAQACGAVGVFASVAGAALAMARIAPEGGVVEVRRPSAAWALFVLGAAWWADIVFCLSPERSAVAWMVEHARAWTWIAMALSAGVLGLSVERTARMRRLELAVSARATAARSLLLVLLGAGTFVVLFAPVRADAVAACVLALAGACVTAAAIHPEAVQVVRVSRRVVALTAAGGGVGFAGAAATEGRADAWIVVLCAVAVALGVGSAAAFFEAPLRPAAGAWLDAVAQAAEHAGRADSEDAIREALLALRAPLGLDCPSPELWTFAPTRMTTVDAAGYLYERDAEIPPALAVVAAGEPEATLRADVLEALEVRRPDLRPLGAWMSARGAWLVTLIASEGEVEGLLVLPAGRRAEGPTLEEVLAVKRAADRLATACRARAAAGRMLERVREARLEAQTAGALALRLQQERAIDTGRHALAAARVARPATVGIYSAASRMALEAIERLALLGAPIVVVAPSGVDPVAYLAHAHLSGIRGRAPLVLVDATSSREQDLTRWSDPSASPLALADGGLLVLLDGAALPLEVQALVARASAERRVPWERAERLDIQLALTAVAIPDDLLKEGRLSPALASRFGDACHTPVVLPRLQDRPEDFRAILTDRLAREGLRTLGRPVGIEAAAYLRLAEYGFPGDDVELRAAVQRLVANCTHDTITAADVERWLPLVRPSAPGRGQNRKKDPLSA